MNSLRGIRTAATGSGLDQVAGAGFGTSLHRRLGTGSTNLTCLHESALCAREIGRSFVDGLATVSMCRHYNPRAVRRHRDTPQHPQIKERIASSGRVTCSDAVPDPPRWHWGRNDRYS